jgi:hypothetical protein
VKEMRVAGVKTLEQANHYLQTEFLPWVNTTRGAVVRVEKRRDGSAAVRFRERYLSVEQCAQRPKVPVAKVAAPKRSAGPVGRKEWCRNFDSKKSPGIRQTVEGSAGRTRESL